MKIKTHILFLTDRTEAERIEGSVFGTMEEVEQQLANDGVKLIGTYELHEFTDGWNSTDGDGEGFHYELDCYFISYVHIKGN